MAMTEEARLTDLGADSIDLYEVIMSLEEKFNINIDDRDAQRFGHDRRHDCVHQKQGQLMERGDPIARGQQR
jgi:Phosphopantetheine attachment site